MTLLRLTAGVVRGGRAVVSGACEGAGFEAIDIVAMGHAGQELSRARLADCMTTGDAGGFEASLGLGGAGEVVKGIYFASPDPGFRMEADARYELTHLFYETEEEYAKSGFGQKRANRPKDQETDAFLSRQLAEAYAGALEDRILMTVSYAYRAVEMGAEEGIARGVELLEARGRDTGLLALSHQFRRDRTHLRVSLLTARWHGELALGRVTEFRATLAELLEFAPHVMISPQVFRTCGNAMRSLSLLAAFSLMTGAGDLAFEALRQAREVLRFAGARLEDDPVVLQEFAGICHLGAAMTPLRKALGRDRSVGIDTTTIERQLVRPAFRSANTAEMLAAFRRAVKGNYPTTFI